MAFEGAVALVTLAAAPGYAAVAQIARVAAALSFGLQSAALSEAAFLFHDATA